MEILIIGGTGAVNFQDNSIFGNTAAHPDLGFRYTVSFLEGAHRMICWTDRNGRIEKSGIDPLDDRQIAAGEHLSAEMMRSLAG